MSRNMSVCVSEETSDVICDEKKILTVSHNILKNLLFIIVVEGRSMGVVNVKTPIFFVVAYKPISVICKLAQSSITPVIT